MCGFIGVISKGDTGPFPEKTLRRMSAMIKHRGPNDSGFFTHGDWLSLAFRRLSILDLSPKGHQPMLSGDGRHVIVYNGEIYNFKELRTELEQKGCSFFSGTDTEVALAAYREWGEKCLNKFTGMFAFIIVDLPQKRAFIARDQLGIKPLFFLEDSRYLIFTSEIKALLPYKELQPEPVSYNEYLVFRSVPGRRTMFKDVFNLQSGHYIKWERGDTEERCYHSIPDTIKPDEKKSFGDACEEAETRLRESVDLHLRSDVELGVQLSGGVDSSLVTAMAAERMSKKLHTFSISFAETGYDESEWQGRVSKRYGTEHHDYPMTEELFMEFLKRSVWHYEHPLNDPNTVAAYYLSFRARDYITVMLSGEGADESFMGYARFNRDSIRTLRLRTWLHNNPTARRLLKRIWPVRKGRALFDITEYDPPMYVLTYADLEVVADFLKGSDSEMEFRHGATKAARGDALKAAILQDEICDLAQWFWRADRMGMASSMELRVPFCTPQMFELANSLSYNVKVKDGMRKAVLKKVAEKYIDREQIYRKKIGFGIPVDTWLKRDGVYKRFFERTMDPSKLPASPGVDFGHFERLYSDYRTGKLREVSSGFLWTYFNFEIWSGMFFRGGWKELADPAAL
jgi:asparagine synthase (glutamine-hydrolysing)